MNPGSLGPFMVFGPSKPSAYAQEGGDYSIQDGGTNVVAEVFNRVFDGIGGLRPAFEIATLMAAAPELFTALEHAVRFHDQLMPMDIERYRAVLAQAKGESV